MSGEVYGVYKATVKNTADPQKGRRAILSIPQVLGRSLSGWAEPSDPSADVPPIGATVWVQFIGGDVRKPMYMTTGDGGLPPKPPTDVIWTTETYGGADGISHARVHLEWIEPTENVDGSALVDLRYYAIRWSYDGVNWGGSVTTTDNKVTLDGLNPRATVYVSVQAVDRDGFTSEPEIRAIPLPANPDVPPAPSAPMVVKTPTGFRIEWDGKDAFGQNMPETVKWVEVHRGDAGFTPIDATRKTTLSGPGAWFDTDVSFGTAYTYALVAVTRAGQGGESSPHTGHTPLEDGISIDDGQISVYLPDGSGGRVMTVDPTTGAVGIAGMLTTGDGDGRARFSQSVQVSSKVGTGLVFGSSSEIPPTWEAPIPTLPPPETNDEGDFPGIVYDPVNRDMVVGSPRVNDSNGFSSQISDIHMSANRLHLRQRNQLGAILYTSELDLSGTGPIRLTTNGGRDVEITGRYVRIGGSEVYLDHADTTLSSNTYLGSDGRVHRINSSHRYKVDVEDFDTGLAALELRPVSWFDKGQVEEGTATRRYAGFIAEEVAAIPGTENLITYDEAGQIESVQYDRVLTMVIPVLKDFQQRITDLEAQMAALQAQVEPTGQ